MLVKRKRQRYLVVKHVFAVFVQRHLHRVARPRAASPGSTITEMLNVNQEHQPKVAKIYKCKKIPRLGDFLKNLQNFFFVL